MRDLGTELIASRPDVDSSIRVPGSVVHVMGRLTGRANVGNPAGARRGSEAVIVALVGLDPMCTLISI